MRALILVTVVVAVGLAACGSSDDTSTRSAAADTTAAETADTAADTTTETETAETETPEEPAPEEPTAAAKLATLDANEDVANDDRRARSIQRHFRSLKRKGCNGPDIHLADLTVTAQKLLRGYDIEESLASILSHVDRSIPARGGKLVGGKCEELFAAYVTLRHT